jgi:hypothetical protein
MKDFLFDSGRDPYRGVLRTGFTVDEGSFSRALISLFPAVENLPRNPKESACLSDVSDLLCVIEDS